MNVTEQQREEVAKAMFDRRCALDEAEPVLADMAWTTDPGVRRFWRAEADHVVSVLGLE